MNLDLFIKTNNLYDMEFEHIKYIDNDIYVYVKMNIEIEYMANGCRPEFDNVVRHLYIFKNQDKCIDYERTQYVVNYNYDGSKLIINLTDGFLIIKKCDIEIKQNIKAL